MATPSSPANIFMPKFRPGLGEIAHWLDAHLIPISGERAGYAAPTALDHFVDSDTTELRAKWQNVR
jgi:hypothetical protein